MGEFRVTVRLPESLRTGGVESVIVDTPVENLAQLANALCARSPKFAAADRSMYNFAVNGELIVHGEESTVLCSNDEVEVVIVFAGG